MLPTPFPLCDLKKEKLPRVIQLASGKTEWKLIIKDNLMVINVLAELSLSFENLKNRRRESEASQ